MYLSFLIEIPKILAAFVLLPLHLAKVMATACKIKRSKGSPGFQASMLSPQIELAAFLTFRLERFAGHLACLQWSTW